MLQSPSWAANWLALGQEIPRISRNPKVHYRTHKRPPPVSILGQPNPVHIPTSHLLEIHPNIKYPSTARSLQWSSSLQYPHQDPIHPLSSPIRATCPAHLILIDFITPTVLCEGYNYYYYYYYYYYTLLGIAFPISGYLLALSSDLLFVTHATEFSSGVPDSPIIRKASSPCSLDDWRTKCVLHLKLSIKRN